MIHKNLSVQCELTPTEIRDLRKQYQFTQTEAAHLVGVSRSTWQKYESDLIRPLATTWGIFLLAIDQHPLGHFIENPLRNE